jgi:hypothetical protein
MRFLGLSVVVACIASGSQGDAALSAPAVAEVRGYLFDDRAGTLLSDDILDGTYVPHNRFGSSVLVVATVDLGPHCVVRTPTPSEAAAIARGAMPSPSRPASCDKASGWVRVTLGRPGGVQQDQRQALSRFSSALDGKLRIPFLFYRADPCVPVQVTARVGTAGGKIDKTVNFVCRE